MRSCLRAARWQAAKWYGQSLLLRIIHMTEFLDESIVSGRIRGKKIAETATVHDPCQIVRRGVGRVHREPARTGG